MEWLVLLGKIILASIFASILTIIVVDAVISHFRLKAIEAITEFLSVNINYLEQLNDSEERNEYILVKINEKREWLDKKLEYLEIKKYGWIPKKSYN